MVEALRDYKPDLCGENQACFVEVGQMTEYKNVSSVRSANPHFKEYDYEIWKGIIDVFAMRVSCFFGSADTLEYERYSKTARPHEIYLLEEKEAQKGRVFVLSAFPEFLVSAIILAWSL